MLNISNIKYSFFLIFLMACQSKSEHLDINNKNLSLVNKVMFYKENPYSGTLFSKIDTLTTYKVSYKNGKKHGKEEKFFFNGKLSESTFYSDGKKSGMYRTWWNNEQLMLEYHYNNTGELTGTQREWSSTGRLLKEKNYTNGNENGWQKVWDYNGKIIANYQVINGNIYGLFGSEKCKSINYID